LLVLQADYPDLWHNPTKPGWREPSQREPLPVASRPAGLNTLRVIAAIKQAMATVRAINTSEGEWHHVPEYAFAA